MSTRALQFKTLVNGFRDPDTDTPLSGGTVEFQSAGTSNPLTVWDEKEKTNPRTSVTLDANGQATVYGDGVYKLVVKDSAGTPVSYSPIDNQKIRAVGSNVVETNTNYTVTTDDDLILCDTSGGAITVTLYPAADFVQPVTIKNISSAGNDVTVDADGSELIDGALTQTLTDAQTQEYFSNGTGWFGSGATTGNTFTTTSLIAGDRISFDESLGITTVNSTAVGELIDVQIFKTAGAHTWTKPAGCTSAKVTVVGGGGGGGGIDNATYRSGGGGGGGGAAIAWVTTLSATEDVVVGAGGAGGVGAAAGTDGGDSSFGTTKVVGDGGGGGGLGDGTVITNTSSDSVGGLGGDSSSTQTDWVSIVGNTGSDGKVLSTVFVSPGRGGLGGILSGDVNRYREEFTPWAATDSGAGEDAGAAGNAIGHGGGGAWAANATIAARNGGYGAAGIVIVEAFT